MSDMSNSERSDIEEVREIEYRQWNHDELAEQTAALEKELIDTLYKLSAVRDDLDGGEIADAYRDGRLLEYLD